MTEGEKQQLGERLATVRERLVDAARAAGRRPEEIRLVAVSKLHPVEAVQAAFALGQRAFGENYVQEALAKQEAFPELAAQGGEWHCIGHVQTNKAKDVAGRFALIHTVDSVKFAETLARRLAPGANRQAVLVQVNIGDEAQKAGVPESDLPRLVESILNLPRLELRGLMCLPPFFDDGEAARPFFARLRVLRDETAARFGMTLPELSMGMSGDFVQAVREGANISGKALILPKSLQPHTGGNHAAQRIAQGAARSGKAGQETLALQGHHAWRRASASACRRRRGRVLVALSAA